VVDQKVNLATHKLVEEIDLQRELEAVQRTYLNQKSAKELNSKHKLEQEIDDVKQRLYIVK